MESPFSDGEIPQFLAASEPLPPRTPRLGVCQPLATWNHFRPPIDASKDVAESEDTLCRMVPPSYKLVYKPH